jgi:hypothetical protein
MTAPLAGLRILDLTRLLAEPGLSAAVIDGLVAAQVVQETL